jgi:hypothetical protein
MIYLFVHILVVFLEKNYIFAKILAKIFQKSKHKPQDVSM